MMGKLVLLLVLFATNSAHGASRTVVVDTLATLPTYLDADTLYSLPKSLTVTNSIDITGQAGSGESHRPPFVRILDRQSLASSFTHQTQNATNATHVNSYYQSQSYRVPT